jgi:FixJ family two-component response regulator
VAPRRWECFVAVVDDDDAVRRALARLIRSLGFEAETYAGGDEFLASLPARRPDCVVLDLHMPTVSGFDVQARMAQEHLAIPIIVITGHDSPETRTRALKGGASAYLCKPLDEQTLMDAIHGAVAFPPRRNGGEASRGGSS